jgi:hypothetical protein
MDRAEITDDGAVVTVHLGPHSLGFARDDVSAALTRLGRDRQIVITGGRQAARPNSKPAPSATATPEAAARPPITQSDIDRALAEVRRQKQPAPIPPGRESGFADMTAAGGVQ